MRAIVAVPASQARGKRVARVARVAEISQPLSGVTCMLPTVRGVILVVHYRYVAVVVTREQEASILSDVIASPFQHGTSSELECSRHGNE